jgi:hypothetical protein
MDTFLAYNDAEGAVVDRIGTGLNNRGLSVKWRISAPLESFEPDVSAARTVVVLLGAAGWGKLQESFVFHAIALSKPIVAVLVGDPPSEALERVNGLFRDRQYLDLRSLDESGIDNLATALRLAIEARRPRRWGMVHLLTEGQTTPLQLPVTAELAGAIARASAIRGHESSFDLTFSSLLLGLYTGEDPTCRWLARYFDGSDVNVTWLYERVNRSAANVASATELATRDRAQLLGAPKLQSMSASRALSEASEIARLRGYEEVDVKDLVAAFATLTQFHEEDYEKLALDRRHWATAFVQYISQTSTSDELESWTRFFEGRFPGRLLPVPMPVRRQGVRPDYNADAYTSEDLLDIDDEVRALSYVIASVKTQPPMAIGLFGEWGSGKTFFMKHLRRRIEKIGAAANKQPARERACHAKVAQIEFNAWHYQDGDLWPSLVDHILRNLRFGEHEQEARLAERTDAIVKKLATSEARELAAQSQVREAEAKEKEAQARLEKAQQAEAKAREALSARLVSREALAAVRVGVLRDEALQEKGAALLREIGSEQVVQNLGGLKEALTDAGRELTGVAAFVVPLFRAKDRNKRTILLLAAIVGPIALGLVLDELLSHYKPLIGRLGALLTSGTAVVASASRWIRKQTEWLKEKRASIEPVVKEVSEKIEQDVERALIAEKAAVVEQLAEVDKAKTEQAAAIAERDGAAKEAASLRGELAAVGNNRLLRTFLDERLSGGEYEKRLGFASLVRRDFERLSAHVQEVTKRDTEGRVGHDELVINRIVLYIDDLDRCNPKQVVAVLRAVHLLLAFPAFVVVVGVDSRWVVRCIQERVKELGGVAATDASRPWTPLDYLEKIFQIPIWLEPVAPRQRAKMAAELLNGRREALLQPKVNGQPKGVAPGADPSGATKTADAVARPGPAGDLESATPMQSAPSGQSSTGDAGRDGLEAHEEKIDLNPEGLDISKSESAFLDKLAPLLSPSPRSIKRFVNTYRLIGVGLGPMQAQDAAASTLNPTDAQIRMFLLAIFVGMPSLSEVLQQPSAERNGNPLALTLKQVVAARLEEPKSDTDPLPDRLRREGATPEWAQVAPWLTSMGHAWEELTFARVAGWFDHVGRYTFNLARSSQILRLALATSPNAETAPDASSPRG